MMMQNNLSMNNILFTGGSGLLGNEIKKLFPNSLFPSSNAFNVVDYVGMVRYLYDNKDVDTIVHMAAIKSPPTIEKDPLEALEVNIGGTATVAKMCLKHNLRLIYISTDYVFDGNKVGGNYTEEDPVNPVNKYAISKLGGECSVKLVDDHAIIRLSFGSNEYPYDGAYVDQYTSREKVSDIVLKIEKVIKSDHIGVIHIGSERRSVYDYAKSISPKKDIKEMSIKDSKIEIPTDTSLDISLYTNCCVTR